MPREPTDATSRAPQVVRSTTRRSAWLAQISRAARIALSAERYRSDNAVLEPVTYAPGA